MTFRLSLWGGVLLAPVVACFNPSPLPTSAETDTESTSVDGTSTTPSTTVTPSTSTSASATTVDPSTTEPPDGSTTDPATTNATGSSGDPPDSSSSSTGETVYAQTVYLNFEGVDITAGAVDDAPNNVTELGATFALSYAGYGGGPDPAAILESVQEKYADLSVLFVDERPVDGSDYAMVVISPTSPFPPGATLGVASQDCDDMNTTPVVFNFFEAGDAFDLELKVNAIAYQFARSTGLDVVDDDVGDIMYQFALPDPASFVDECLHLREVRPPNCPAQHTGVCPAGGEQNSYAELLDRFGPL